MAVIAIIGSDKSACTTLKEHLKNMLDVEILTVEKVEDIHLEDKKERAIIINTLDNNFNNMNTLLSTLNAEFSKPYEYCIFRDEFTRPLEVLKKELKYAKNDFERRRLNKELQNAYKSRR